MIKRDAKHETIGFVIADLPVGSQMLVPTRIMNFQPDLLLIKLLNTFKYIEHTRLVML